MRAATATSRRIRAVSRTKNLSNAWSRHRPLLLPAATTAPRCEPRRFMSKDVVTAAESSAVATRPADQTAAYAPIDFSVKSKIEGEESQVAMIDLAPGECVRAESGAMIFMTDGIQMNTQLAGASSAFRRMLTGQNLFLTDYTADKAGTLCLGTDFPSKILRLNLQDMPEETLICQRGAFLAFNTTVDIEMEFTKSLKAGFFGGQGFVLQRLVGEGDVLLKAGGTLVEKTLSEGQTLRVTSGSIVAFERTIDYDVEMMPGIKNAMFGGEGLFVTKLTGPGRVWLQGMPADRMIAEIARRVPGPGIGLGVPIGMGGGGSEGGEAEGAEEESAAAAVDGTGAEQVAATDAAIEADRQATVATSGMKGSEAADPNSPEALFGDAAPKDAPSSSPADAGVPDAEEASFASSSSSETSFGDEGFGASEFDESQFSTEEFTPGEESFKGDEFFGDDAGNTTDFGESTTDAVDQGGGIMSTLWDFFMGGDE